jgi:hypothetical protein
MVLTLPRQTFMHSGKRWTRFPAERVDYYVVGLDLGASADPTALCVTHHQVEPLETWTPNEKRGRLDQDVKVNYDVVHLERLRLGSSYFEQVAHVADVLNRPPLPQVGADLVLDETGCGRPVADLFDAKGLQPQRVVITAGYGAERHGPRRWAVPKHELISGLDAALHTGKLKIAAALTEAGALRDELKDFRRLVSAAGRATFSARVGRHDDLVLAVSLSVWWALERRKHRMYQGPLKGLC